MHDTPKCTELSSEAIFGISSTKHNVSVYCQNCSDLKSKVEVSKIICSSREIAKLNEMHENIKIPEERLTTVKTLKNEIKNELKTN